MNVLSKFDLSTNIALVTGGAGLLGLQHCEALLEAGSKVVILDIDKNAIKRYEEAFSSKYKNKIYALHTDITSEVEIISAKENIYKKFNAFPSILINNAAIDAKYETDNKINATRLEDFALDQWNMEVSVGLSGAFLCSKHFGVEMARVGKGVILNISSDLGLIAPSQFLYEDNKLSKDRQTVKPVTYSVIKHGLIGLTRYISTYWAKDGVRCNAMAPGGVFNDHDAEFKDKLSKLIPMGRMADIDEYKATIVYMCSDASSYMNGSIISIDGGRTGW
jgi:NAD(P)-dependent dehydrogenase (short-subunit alcohol dehydrogenase family)|tara:strand:+ start:2953 stop:3783 length:831 start_codon:yes stop_codon:yes gene_type:complete